jgi:hypothetical protein
MRGARIGGLLVLALGMLVQAADGVAVEIETIVEPQCFPGNSPGGCFLTPYPLEVEGTFGAPPDRHLDFRFVVADGQRIALKGLGGYNLAFDSSPDVTLTVEGITLQDRAGRDVATTGPLGQFPPGYHVGSCSESIPEEARGVCDEQFQPFDDAVFQQVLVSFSLDIVDDMRPQVRIIHLVITSGGGQPDLLAPEPSVPSLAAIALMSMIATLRQRRVRRIHGRRYAKANAGARCPMSYSN